MSNCQKYKGLIEKVVDGTIINSELSELKAHTDTCQSCREELKSFNLIQEVVTEAFSSPKGAKRAGERILHKLSVGPHPQSKAAGWMWKSIAAGILLVVGVMLGLGLGMAGLVKPGGARLAAKVPVRVVNLKGTVLVKHAGRDTWQILERNSTIHLGDMFHSTGKSAFILGLGNKSTIEVDQNSMLVLKSYNGQTQFYLEHGECTAALESPHGPFFIETPHGRVEALGTEFTVTVE